MNVRLCNTLGHNAVSMTALTTALDHVCLVHIMNYIVSRNCNAAVGERARATQHASQATRVAGHETTPTLATYDSKWVNA